MLRIGRIGFISIHQNMLRIGRIGFKNMLIFIKKIILILLFIKVKVLKVNNVILSVF